MRTSPPTSATRPRLYVPLALAAPFVLDSDLLAFRGGGRLSRLIQRGGRGEYSHVAKAIRWGSDLMCCEVREWVGARAVTLKSQVDKYPGQIDVYRANSWNRWPEYKAGEAARMMRRLAGSDYGYAAVLRASLSHLPFTRWFYSPNTDDQFADGDPPFCSQAVAMCDRIAGGVDPTLHTADAWTEPSDLVRSPFYEAYLCTLVPASWEGELRTASLGELRSSSAMTTLAACDPQRLPTDEPKEAIV